MNDQGSSSEFSQSYEEMANLTLSGNDDDTQFIDEIENWFPESISRVLNINELQLLTLDNVETQEAHDDIGCSQGFGLRVVTDMKCSPDGKPHKLICLTTIQNIYVLRPMIHTDILFLKRQLERRDIEQRRVYVWEGTQVGLYLNRLMNIRLEDQTDLESFDLNLTFDRHIDEHVNQIAFLTVPYVGSVIKPKKKNFPNLAQEWLGIEPHLLQTSKQELADIGQFPLSVRACNVIKKRCVLLRQVGEVMMSTFEQRRRRPLELIYGMAHRASADVEAFRNSAQDYADLM